MKILMAVMAFSVMSLAGAAQVWADGCYLCGSGSSNGCQQCKYSGSDSFDQRKACEKKGCKVSGTGSCSSASNVKVCRVERVEDTAPVATPVAWCAAR